MNRIEERLDILQAKTKAWANGANVFWPQYIDNPDVIESRNPTGGFKRKINKYAKKIFDDCPGCDGLKSAVSKFCQNCKHGWRWHTR